jgi:hypothetical protein
MADVPMACLLKAMAITGSRTLRQPEPVSQTVSLAMTANPSAEKVQFKLPAACVMFLNKQKSRHQSASCQPCRRLQSPSSGTSLIQGLHHPPPAEIEAPVSCYPL